MKKVKFKEALHMNQAFSGEFQLVKGPYTRAGQKRDVMFKIIKDGAITRVHAYHGAYQVIGGEDSTPEVEEVEAEEIDIDELKGKIDRRFKVMDKLISGVIESNIRALIISAAAGVGKSYTLERRLGQALLNKDINKFTILKGKISAIALYAQLFEHKEEGDVLVLDDIDIIFQDETSLNLLKGALDTGERRHLDWLTASTWLEENGIDSEFDFNGCCVFITNLDFDRMIERGSVLAPHFKALLSRSIYLDLAIHTPLEIMVRVDQVVENTPILDVQGIDTDHKKLIMDWLWENYKDMRELSIRSVMKLGYFVGTDYEGWKELAEVTLLKGRRL